MTLKNFHEDPDGYIRRFLQIQREFTGLLTRAAIHEIDGNYEKSVQFLLEAASLYDRVGCLKTAWDIYLQALDLDCSHNNLKDGFKTLQLVRIRLKQLRHRIEHGEEDMEPGINFSYPKLKDGECLFCQSVEKKLSNISHIYLCDQCLSKAQKISQKIPFNSSENFDSKPDWMQRPAILSFAFPSRCSLCFRAHPEIKFGVSGKAGCLCEDCIFKFQI